ncbi:DUF7444 family protein [Gibbsiella quercinecans]|uniref:DUF7444 family protein n=1 Tax=Gibbsiella quercinecans TaxID=929813 RepID=UPI00242ABC44|nr:hypothetical protein [Gibbsiella quercinecans]
MAVKKTEATATVEVIGSCLVRYNRTDYKHADTFEIDEADLELQGIKHLFASKVIQFLDDSKRTRDLIKNIKVKEDKPIAQDGGTI